MKRFQKVLFALAVVVALGVSSAFAQQCTVTAAGATSGSVNVPVPSVVRAEGTTEILGAVDVVCGQVLTALITSTISVTLSPAGTRFSPVAGSSVGPNFGQTTTCSATAATNTGTFPCPTIETNDAAGFTGIPTVTIANNVITFIFQPAGATAQTFQIRGLRANVGTSGLATGGAITAVIVTGGGAGTRSFSSVAISTVNNVLGVGSGLLLNGAGASKQSPLSITSCGPAAPTPAGTPNNVAANPDLFALSSVPVTVVEGFSNALANGAQVLAGGFGLSPDIPASAGIPNGIRLQIKLTGVPSNIQVYAPRQITSATAATTGIVTGGTALTVLQRVDSTLVAADGSGGTPLGAPTLGANQFDLVGVAGGVANVVYEVTTGDLTSLETITIIIAITGTSNTGVGAVSGALSVAPVGPATVNAARPQFRAGTSETVANVILCASYLLFPYVVNTGDGAYDTGISIANTTADPSVIGTTNQAGDVTLYFWPKDGSTAPAPVTFKTGLAAGQSAIDTLSNILKGAKFQGYMIAVCNFTLGHGFAFINSPQPGTGGQFAMGYLALSVSNPRIPTLLTPPIESRGH